jgi:tRNA-dihydrouridine synthase B
MPGPSHSDDILTLAPMRGLTGQLYRNAFARHFGGLDLAIAPFISTVKAARIKPSLVKDLLPGVNRHLPVIPQLIGRDPDDFLVMAEHLAEMGYKELNWNLGCPWPMVVKRRRGSGLLEHPELIEAVLERVVGHTPCRLSLKVRLGVSDPDRLLALVPLINRYPLSEVIIHARTASQMYEGTPDVDRFERCLDVIEHPVAYNGDINTVEDFNRLSARFPRVHHWMLGRGILTDPFLALSIRGGREIPGDRIGRIRDFLAELYGSYCETLFGPRPILGKMKELWLYQSNAFTGGARLLKQIQRTKTLEDYDRVVGRFFDGKPALLPRRHPARPCGRYG